MNDLTHDIRPETTTFPQPFPLDRYQRLLIVAPHPDDEIYGCGGLIALARRRGTEITVLILTDGGAAERISPDANPRYAESLAAADLLGHRVHFLKLADRSLRYDETLIGLIAEAVQQSAPDLVLAPALNEPHPDHQATALATLAALLRQPAPCDLAFYESGGALTNPTHLLDISAVVDAKRAAMACFVSQEAVQPYAKRTEARDVFRALTLGPSVHAAEAFQLLPIKEHGFTAALPALDALFLHSRGQAAYPSDAPLVSILIRTVGDPHLEEAVASALAQTWRPIEIVIVAAHAQDIFTRYPHWANNPLIRQILPKEPLNRPQAANAALDAARGEYLLFLDDDDLLLPEHVATLLETMRLHHPAQVAFGHTRVIDAHSGAHLRDYTREFSRERLLADNLFPIHAALFHRGLLDRCRFDEALSVYEDWDFWLQLSQHDRFYPTNKLTAIYRYRDRSGLQRPEGRAVMLAARAHIRKKWHHRADELSTALEYLANYLDAAEQRYERLLQQHQHEMAEQHAYLRERDARIADLEAVVAERDDRIADLEAMVAERDGRIADLEAVVAERDGRIADLEAVVAERDRQIRDFVDSTCWRVTKPIRWLGNLLRGRSSAVRAHGILLKVIGSPSATFFPAVTLEKPSPMKLPEGIWSGGGKDWGGMRRFLVPMETVGCQVVRQGGVLYAQSGGGRVVIRLDAPAKNVKLVFRIAGETPVEFFVEFGVLEGNVWRPLLRDRVQVVPGTPTVLHRRLPATADAMAFEFPSAGPVPLAQIAVIAVSPLERVVGPLLSRLRRPGGKPAAGNDRPQLAVSTVAESSARLARPAESLSADPYAYMSQDRQVSLAGRRVAVLASSEGNRFMAEIAATVAGGAEELGAEVVRGNERSLSDFDGFDWVIVAAPHEFFTLGAGRRWPAVLERHRERLLLFNTEQPQTAWFQTAAPFFSLARALLDIHYQTAVHLRRQGFPAYFVPLGPLSRSGTPQALPSHPAFEHLAPAVRERLPDDYGARPFDVVFVGTASPRRQAFFARHAGFFAGLNTFLYLPEGNVPFKDGQSRTLDFTALSGLVRRAKIVLNVHRDEQPYLEWQRMVNLGILQETLVISEHCDFCPALRANGDYVDLPLTLIPDACSHYLAHPEEAERFALRGCERLRRDLPMTRVLARLLAALEETS